ncbi:MAG TPA: S1 RNA-binding domain-containing protein, partial [Vicinamibacteria bacterium]
EIDSPEPEPEPEEEEDFARMLEESLQAKRFREGDEVSGKVVAVGTDVAFVDVGGKGEATIDLEELREPDGPLRISVGDTVKAIVVSTSGGMKLSHKLARHAATREALRDAYESGLPVEGRVEAVIKGGYEVRFSGQRAFCPISQIDTSYTEDPAIHQGKVYLFRIVEFKGDGKNIVVSRRALLEEEERARAEEVRKLIVPDAVLRGRVASVREYGAFVDLGGGIQGLLHVSEMGWSRVTDPASVVQPGDEIEVKVLNVDEEKGKISLGLKQLQADPWTTAASTFAVGQVLSGRVTRVADFGAFLELAPGIEALAHVSTFPPTGRTGGWKALVPAGAQLPVEVLSIDVERRRIGVAVVEEGSAKARSAEPIKPGTRMVGRVERHENYGVFVFLKAGATGLIPLEETGAERDGDLKKLFPVGNDVEVMVLDVDPSGRRIRLSRKAILEATDREQAREYQERENARESGGFGSLAETLRKAIEKRGK